MGRHRDGIISKLSGDKTRNADRLLVTGLSVVLLKEPQHNSKERDRGLSKKG